MLLSERLQQVGMTEADIELVESAINEKAEALAEEKAEKLLESKLDDVQAQIRAIVEGFEDKFDSYSKTLIESIEKEYKPLIETEINSVVESFKDKFDEYSEVILAESLNEAKTQDALKVQMAESLIKGIAKVYEAHNLELPEDAASFEDKMNEEVDALKSELADISESLDKASRELIEMKKQRVFESLTESMSIKQREAFAVVAESLLFTDEEAYREKMVKLSESFSIDKKADKAEKVEKTKLEESVKPEMNKYVSYMNKKR